MTTSVGKFIAETGEGSASGRRFAAETSRILEARIDGTVWARLGAMVAYRGDLTFEHAGIREKGIGRTIKEKFTGEEVPLMTVQGSGSAYFAAGGRKLTVVSLDVDDSITVNGMNVLAFEESVGWDLEFMKSLPSMLVSGLFNVTLDGPGNVAVATGASPLTLEVSPDSPVRTDPAATVLWSRGLEPDVHSDIGTRSLFGRYSGEEVQLEFGGGDGFVVIQSKETASL